jgi:hypothetical protein
MRCCFVLEQVVIVQHRLQSLMRKVNVGRESVCKGLLGSRFRSQLICLVSL